MTTIRLIVDAGSTPAVSTKLEKNMNKLIQNIRNRIQYYKEPKTYQINDDLECEVTDEIEKALWRLKDDLDLPTEEIEMAVDSRKNLKGEKNGRTI